MADTIDQKKRWQILFRDMGFYNLKIDGDWGKGSQSAHQQAKSKGIVGDNIFDLPLCFSNKVSKEFVDKVFDISKQLKLNEAGPDQLMACMAWESAETFSPSIRNAAGSNAVGLIQYMPTTAKALGTSTDALAKMTAVEQLEWVYKYFKPYTGKVQSIADLYMCILYPVAVGKANDYTLFDKVKSPVAYRQNMGIDINKDSKCTKQEAATKVVEKMIRGFKLLK